MKAFDLINSPLSGVNLIEASAGTGKTHTISLLVIRLILEKQLTIDRILIVTFTQAAAQELRDRVLHLLLITKDALSTSNNVDILIDGILSKRKDKRRNLQIIQNAITDFDKAAIFTIHGFCNRILSDHAFETGNRFDTELVTDPVPYLKETAQDFWRKQMYSAPLEFVSYVHDKIKDGPGYFFNLISRINALDIRIIPEVMDSGLSTLDHYRKTYSRLKGLWLKEHDNIIDLLSDPALKGTVYGSMETDEPKTGTNKRTVKIEHMSGEMDRFLFHKSPGFPLFKGFENFTSAKLIKSVKKNAKPPAHDFFDICADLLHLAVMLDKECRDKFLHLKGRFFSYVHEEMDKRKQTGNVQFYNDLILKVRNAAKEINGADHALIKEISAKYKAALVDEFQDTDAVQYEIFSRLFSGHGNVLFMIGDPKQSIYSFRGADVFSYMEAARNADHSFTLTENWRSDEKLIKGINTIFSNVSHPFIFKDISYEPGKPGDNGKEREQWNTAPITLWFMASNDEKPLNKATAERRTGRATADEIVRLLASGSGNIRIKEEDIAILVRTNRQALIMKNHLSSRNIHAVLYSPGDIFDTHEAVEMERLLAGILEPEDDQKFRSALTTDTIGQHAEAFESTDEALEGLEEKFETFKTYNRIWSEKGFIRMFNQCLTDENVKQRLLSYPDGERRVTNILHLAEILQRESLENKRRMSDLMKWLSEQRDPKTPRREENQLLLESDRRAIHIVTIHKSKGLEYPVVFCPFSWEGMSRREDNVFFHDNRFGKKLTDDMREKESSPHLSDAQIETLGENLRLFYVAVTRAKQACYITWGHVNSAETSPLTYLLYGNHIKENNNLIHELKALYCAKSSEILFSDVQALARKSEKTIQAAELPYREKPAEISPSEEKEIAFFCRSFHGIIDPSWRISSYSSFVSQRERESELPDYDHLAAPVPEDLTNLSQKTAPEESTIFSFPKGIKAGLFFHDLLENLEFTSTDIEHHKQLIHEKLIAHGFDSGWKDTVYRTIRDLLDISFSINNHRCTLSTVKSTDRIHEMEFYYPSKRVTPETFKNIFSEFRHHDALKEFPIHLEALTFSPAEGFIKGYIDLVFHYEDKFYIIDWKTNFLGNHITQYHADVLKKVMWTSLYTLQYYMYVISLHQYLKNRYASYRYDKNFGGIFYVFLRGIDIHSGPAYGIFADCPEQALLDRFGHALIPGFRG